MKLNPILRFFLWLNGSLTGGFTFSCAREVLAAESAHDVRMALSVTCIGAVLSLTLLWAFFATKVPALENK